MASSPEEDMVVSSTTSHMSSSLDGDEGDRGAQGLAYHNNNNNPPSRSLPPPAHLSSLLVSSETNTSSSSSNNVCGNYSIEQPGSLLSRSQPVHEMPFPLEDVRPGGDMRLVPQPVQSNQSQHHSSSSSSPPPSPDAADIDSTTNDHSNQHVQYSSSPSSITASSRFLSSQSSSSTSCLPSYSESQQIQSHLQIPYYESDLHHQQIASQQTSYSTSGSSSVVTATAVQQLQLLLQSSSSNDIIQGSSSHVYSQPHHHMDYEHNSESSQQQIIRLYHHLQESAASLSANNNSLDSASINTLAASLENSTHGNSLNNSLHHSWQQQPLGPMQHQMDASDLQLNDYEDEDDDDEDNQGLDLATSSVHLRSSTSSTNNNHVHHHFMINGVLPVEGQSSLPSHHHHVRQVHEQQQHPLVIHEGLEDEEVPDVGDAVDEQGMGMSNSDEIVISDVPVESRARASLPSAYLFIDIVMDNQEDQDFNSLSSDPVVYGVFARKTIPERTQFGPVEGVISSINSKTHLFNQHQQNLIVFISESLILDQSDENKSNWMRFVRTANSASCQNLILVTKEQTQPNPENVQELITTTKFYFMTTKCINPREELRVWYSKDYAERFRLKLLEEFDAGNSSRMSSSGQHNVARQQTVPRDLSMFRSTASAPPSMSSNHFFSGSVGHSLPQVSSQSHRLSHQETHGSLLSNLASSLVMDQSSSQSSSFNVQSGNQLPNSVYPSSLQLPHLHHVQSSNTHPPATSLTLTTLDPVPIDFNLTSTSELPASQSHLNQTPNLQSYHRAEQNYQQQQESEVVFLQQKSDSRKESTPHDLSTSSANNNTSNNVSEAQQFPAIVAVESPSTSLIPATPPTASGGHKLRNKIAKTQQQQQLQLLKQHRSQEGGSSRKDSVSEGQSSRPSSSSQLSSSNLTSSTTGSLFTHQHKCDVCGKTFNRFYSLRRHQIMHSGEKKFKCPVCNMCFSHVYNRNRHVKRHANRSNGVMRRTLQQTAQAAMAAAAAKDKTNQENHPIDNTEQKRNRDEDGLLLDCSSSSTSIILIGNNPKKPFKCGQCYKCFTTEDRLVKHALVHSDDDRHKPFSCSYCDKRFLNNSALSCHLKIHSVPKDQPRKYDCILCGDEFESTQSRKEHLISHQDPLSGRFPCTHCKKKFDEFPAVRKHIRAFHSNRQFPCSVCGKIFPRPDKLKLHMLKHSDHREFLCQTCGKQFKRKDKLKEHINRMHAVDREAKLAAKAAAKAAAVEAATAQLRAAVESAAMAANQAESSTVKDLNKTDQGSKSDKQSKGKKFVPKVSPSDYHRFVYKCHSCQLGFKRRGMLVNHLAKRHPETPPEAVPELNLPILKTTRDYFCQYCDKVYKSSSKRKAHILKNHPGKSLPLSHRIKGGISSVPGVPNPTYSAPVGSVPTRPHHCNWCHKQYASKAKLSQHLRKKHPDDYNGTKSNETLNQEQEKNENLSKPNHVVDHMTFVSTTGHQENNHNNCIASPNLASILGSLASTADSSVPSDLQQLLQSHGSNASDILNQAMAEFTSNQDGHH